MSRIAGARASDRAMMPTSAAPLSTNWAAWAMFSPSTSRSFTCLVDPEILQGRLRRPPVGGVSRVGDGDLPHRRVGHRLHAERLQVERRALGHPDDDLPDGVEELRLVRGQPLVDELAGVVDVGREVEVERGPVGELGEEVARRAVGHLDVNVRVPRAEGRDDSSRANFRSAAAATWTPRMRLPCAPPVITPKASTIISIASQARPLTELIL